MNILMMSNTYIPIVGGVERSIQNFSNAYRELGHRVIVVAPEFKKQPKKELDVIRVPAIQNFSGTDFSVNLPIPELVTKLLSDFHPHVVHSHHPFLMGDMALRIAAQLEVPLVFTYHTLYEQYANYPILESRKLRRFIVALAAGYANLADHIFAPSQIIRDLLIKRGIKTPIDVIPTGIDLSKFKNRSRNSLRQKLNIPRAVFLIGHVGRLSPEKNLNFLIHSVISFMKKNPSAAFILAGKGDSEGEVKRRFEESGLSKRFFFYGLVEGRKLAEVYQAMDVFAFASQSETQGIVLLEAMACGTPVIALAAQGVDEIVKDFINGRIVHAQNEILFSSVLQWFHDLPDAKKVRFKAAAINTAKRYSMNILAARAIEIYNTVRRRNAVSRALDEPGIWEKIMNRISAEWDLFKNTVQAAGKALIETKKKSEEEEKLIQEIRFKARSAA